MPSTGSGPEGPRSLSANPNKELRPESGTSALLLTAHRSAQGQPRGARRAGSIAPPCIFVFSVYPSAGLCVPVCVCVWVCKYLPHERMSLPESVFIGRT